MVVVDEIQKAFDIPKELMNDNERQRRVYHTNGVALEVLGRADSAKILVQEEPRIIMHKMESNYDQASRVYDEERIAVTIQARDYKDPQKVLVREEIKEMETRELKEAEKATGTVDERDERIKQLEEENVRLKAQLFDYMMKERTA